MREKPTYEELEQRIKELERTQSESGPGEEASQKISLGLLSIFDGIDEPVYVCDPKTYEMVFSNRVIKDLFGEVDGRKCYEYLQKRSSPCPFCTNDRIFDEKNGQSYIWEHRNEATGRWYRCIDKAIKWPDGRLVRYEMAVDITDRKRVEEALRESEENLATTLHSIGDGVIATDEQGLIVNMNPMAEKLCGWPLADATGKPLGEVFRIVNAITRDAVEDPVRKVLEIGGVVGLANHTMLLSRDGAEYQIADSAAPIRDREGRVTGVVLVFSDYTEKYAIAEKLRLSEERYDLAMEVKNEGVWDWNLVTDEAYFDDRYYKMAGYEPNELPQDFKCWAEHVHPDDLPHAREEIRAYLSGESDIFDIEFRFGCKDDSWIWIRGRGKIVERDAGGNPLRMIGTHTDITRQKQAKAALQESEERFRLFAELAPVGIIISDEQENVLYASRKFTELFGYTMAEIPSVKEWWPLAYPDEKLRNNVRVEWKRVIDEAVSSRSEIRPMEFPVTCKDGTIRQIDFRMRTAGDINVIIFSDITERKKSEEALRRRLAYEQAVSQISTWAVETDDLNRFLDDCLDLLGKTLDVSRVYIFEHRDETDTMDNTFEWVAQGVTPQKDGLQGFPAGAAPWFVEMMKQGRDIRFADIEDMPDEATRSVLRQQDILSILVIPLFVGKQYYGFMGFDGCASRREWAQDDVDLLIAMARTITGVIEQKQAEQEREKLEAQLHLSQKMEAIGTLAAGIAHNFNNILLGVQGRASLMMIDKDSSHSDYEHLKGIEEYVRNAVELTKSLLGFARGGKYEAKPTDLNELIINENNLFGRTKKEIRIQGKFEKDLWAVEVDQGQIRQVLLNLYVNAWQAMPGGGDIYVQTENVTLEEEFMKPFEIAAGRYVKVSITDTGIGMDSDTRKKIFDPFFSTKDKGQGSGLGLASVYGIIKNHGGFINVYSEKGKGTTFNIYLPASDREVIEEESAPDLYEIRYGEGTVLLVDDEAMILEVGRMMLERLGYSVLVAVGGREAIDIYGSRREEIDLVILDMIMPGMGGGETYDLLKEIDGDVRVLLSSGYTIDGLAKEIMARGCKGFIQKPFAMEELSRKVGTAIAR